MKLFSTFFCLKWFFSRSAILYIILVFIVLTLVDTKAVISRFQTRDLNEARPPMASLVSFNTGRTIPEKINWTPYLNYFSLVLKYAPNEAVSEMFLGICQYYAKNQKNEAWTHIRHSAETNPLIFWNIYNAGILAFERGDMRTANDYFEKAVVLPEDKIFNFIRSSVVYRQVMSANNFNTNFLQEIHASKENIYLLLSAANFYAGNYDQAKNIATYGLGKIPIKDKEPFFFYMGAAAFSLGKTQESLAFFGKCIELKSNNPMVYRYTGQIMASMGNTDAANSMFKIEQSLKTEQNNTFPYADRLKLRFF